MLVGTMVITINLPGIRSLKEKRKIVKSLVERLRNRFNFSVSEVAANESKLQAVIGLAMVSDDGVHIERQIDKVSEFVHADGRFFVSRIEREMFSVEE
ncbi:hypothetical protein STSP2_02418 [Anaerohalosphaera lusitana]|uniref:DUF503 domain-containing protein n=1 Tax=Anaerohalosphaera lusitana TaxID=1936003 RepID=A0A1U9NMU9_9BACT|nr:DUF503 domain-containing protein [Anaerohalosphaera lusitana]AQT69229.1 hypothetical protein STSP2_02418 [Anaerohalosphaera lusitana]